MVHKQLEQNEAEKIKNAVLRWLRKYHGKLNVIIVHSLLPTSTPHVCTPISLQSSSQYSLNQNLKDNVRHIMMKSY